MMPGKFYEKAGFVEIAVRREYYTSPQGLVDAALMKKELLD